MDNKDIQKSTILSTQSGNGLLLPEQASQFWRDAYEQMQLGAAVSKEMHRATSGTIHKVFGGQRTLKAKSENTAGADLAGVSYGQVGYHTKELRLDWEVSGKQLRENIEGASFEQTVSSLMLANVAQDVEDLSINGDEASVDGFVNLNDGFVAQIMAGGKKKDAGAVELSLDLFYAAIAQMENKYVNSNLRWVMSPKVKRAWEAKLLKDNIANGGGYIESLSNAPAGIPVLVVDKMPQDKILLVDPKNLTIVNTYNMAVKKDDMSKDVISRDVIFYTVQFDIDFIIQHAPATLALHNFVL